jgi:hypothetical protein
LIKLRGLVTEIEDALVPIMTGLVQMTRLMRPSMSIPVTLVAK